MWSKLTGLFIKRLIPNSVIESVVSSYGISLISQSIFPYSGGIFDEAGNFFGPSSFLPEKTARIIVQSRYIWTIRSKCATTIGHGGWNNYYHWYIDSLPRVFGLREIDPLKKIDLFISQPLSKQEKDLLQALVGQNIKIRYVSRFTMVKAREAYYLPFLSKSCDAELPAEYLSFYKNAAFKLFPQSPPRVPFKIFISRAGSGRRVFINEVEVEETLEKHGYTILRLETLTLSQQIYYFRFAEKVVASHGAGLTNLLYSSQCGVLEIFHSREVLSHYMGLCKAGGLQYKHVCLDGKHKDDNVFLPLNNLMDWLSLR